MRTILINLFKKQILNDVAIEANMMARVLRRNPETEDQANDLMDLTDELNYPTLARAMTEGFGEVKQVCQRYLVTGRDTDDNRLERPEEAPKYEETVKSGLCGYDLICGIPYVIAVEAAEPVTVLSANGVVLGNSLEGSIKYTPATTGRIKVETHAEEVHLSYYYGKPSSLELELLMPVTFNLGVTETMKSSAHRMIVDHVIYTLLLNQWPEKSAIYRERFQADADSLRNALQARTGFCRHAEDWS